MQALSSETTTLQGTDAVFQDALRKMAATLGGETYRLTLLAGGRNNRVWRLDAGNGAYLLKSYFKHPDDRRDRLAAEFAFASYAWACGCRRIPQPVACEPGAAIGLYEFIRGRPLEPGDVGEDFVAQARSFVRELNLPRYRSAAAGLPKASESCLSLSDHLDIVEGRIGRLAQMQTGDRASVAARSFVRDALEPAWQRIRKAAQTKAEAARIPFQRPIDRSEQCVSPSDFGAHNALVEDGGRLRFVDFEYAGWDDPAKLICDFFCQPALPVPARFFHRFRREIAYLFERSDQLATRAELLLPVYRIKWCCILLNDFLPVDGRRRRFAAVGAPDDRRPAQLEKARDYLKRTLGDRP